MYVTVSSELQHLSESICSLNFASRCRAVALGKAKRNSRDGRGAGSVTKSSVREGCSAGTQLANAEHSLAHNAGGRDLVCVVCGHQGYGAVYKGVANSGASDDSDGSPRCGSPTSDDAPPKRVLQPAGRSTDNVRSASTSKLRLKPSATMGRAAPRVNTHSHEREAAAKSTATTATPPLRFR